MLTIQNKMGKDQQFVSFKQDIRGLNVDPNTLYELIDDEEKGLVLVDVKTKQVLENILRRDPSGTCVLQGDQFNRSFCNSIVNIQYAFDEVRLLNVPNTHLNNLVHYLHALDPLHLSLSSHTDCRGPDSYNGPLSDGRAGSAESYLKVTLLLMNYLEIPTNADISTVHELTRLVFDEKESVEEFLGNSLLSHYGNTEVKSNFLKYLKTARLDSLTLDRANRGKKAKNQTTIFNLIWNDLADSNSDIFRLKNEFSLNEIYNDDFNSQMEEIAGRIDAQGMGESHPVHAFSDCHLINGKNVCEMKDQAIIDLFKNMSKEDLQKKCPDLNLTSEQILKNHLENRRTDYVLKY